MIVVSKNITKEFTEWIKSELKKRYGITVEKPDEVIDCEVYDDIDKPGLYEHIKFRIDNKIFVANNQHNDTYRTLKLLKKEKEE